MRFFFFGVFLLGMNAVFADELVGFAAYENGDYTTAYPHLMQAAREDNDEAMYLLGKMYEYGYGVSEDLKESRQWYLKSAQKPPYYPSHQLMKNTSEFRLLKGVSAEMNQSIQPFISALPESTPVNVNTATKVVLKSLGNGLKEPQIEELIATRGENGFKSNKLLIPLLQKLNISAEQVTIQSQYFLSKAHVSNEDLSLTVYVLLKRTKDKKGNISVSVVREETNGF